MFTVFSACGILISMIKKYDPQNVWALQDAKARFSEVVRQAKANGPQRVTVHSRDEVVVIAASDFDSLTSKQTGQDLIDALRAAPFDFDTEREPELAPVRAVKL